MQKQNDQILYSASDLCSFLECPHLLTLELTSLDTPLERDEPDEESALIRQKGISHENRYLTKLENSGKKVIDVGNVYGPHEKRLEATTQALADSPDVIYQAFLLEKPFLGYADFLIKVDRASELGAYSYEAVDTKLALHSKPYYIIQLCMYSEILQNLQGLMPERIHVVLGDGRRDSFYVKDYFHYYSHLKSEFLKHTQTRPETYPEPCSFCDQCDFRTLCSERRLADDHLSQVANIRKSQIKRLASIGVTTMAGLAACDKDHVKGIGDQTLARLKSQSRLQHDKKQSGKDKFVVIPPDDPNRGLHTLPEPNDGDLFFDIEGDPLFPEGLEYLFGVHYKEDGEYRFLDLWSHSHAEEKKSFEKLISFFMERLNKYPGMHIYHYAAYEQTAVKRLMSRYATMEYEVDHLLRQKIFVDLYQVVRHSVMVSEPKYSIKNLEHFYMDARDAEVKSAGASIVYYEKYIESGEQKFLDDIRAYNLDDCRSLELLRDWLLKLRSNARYQTPPPVEVEMLEDREDPQQEQIEVFERSLLAGLPEDESEFTDSQRIDKLLCDLANFYRREAKPAWWMMFARQTMTTDELIEDGECLGGLVKSEKHPPFKDKRSTVYTYSFPEQDYKFKEGDTPHFADDLNYAGSIVALDHENRLIQLKRGDAGGPLPDKVNLVPRGPVNTDSLRHALWDFISDYIESKIRKTLPHKALIELLQRRHPDIQGVAEGEPLYTPGSISISTCQSIAERMNDTYLFIQGPPGTGKTYTASHLIVSLMKAGKKIAVTANSHKVIHNLLEAVEDRADESGYTFTGIKKSGNGLDSHFEGNYVQSVSSNEAVDGAVGKVQLVAGTAWLLSRYCDRKYFDYLFIDEAGQVSLANLIAAGQSAKNIVLIGDQMQLAQPIQGVHPGESGQSVLDYLLQGRHTIPIEEGILLDTTYRMHPRVCDFISEAVYDGRIRSLDVLKNQAILSDGDLSQSLPEAGIICEYVEHEGSQQRSDEEAERIEQLFEALLEREYRDRYGNTGHLRSENVLVVSPYNMQVNNLKRILGDDARVGTVDKFQGQEAEVVIVSMATSNPDDIPRGIDFLYSQNRLNVSLSRARTLSVLVMSPQLLNVRCNTIEQMRLVNTLCWVSEYSKSCQTRVRRKEAG